MRLLCSVKVLGMLPWFQDYGWKPDQMQPLLAFVGRQAEATVTVRYLVVGWPNWSPIFFGLLEYIRVEGSDGEPEDLAR